MDRNDRILQIVTNEIKEKICDLDALTPGIFATIFSEVAKKHNVENLEFVKEYVDKQTEKYLKLQEKTSQHTDILSKNTSKAIEAIKKKDDAVLEEVQNETQKLKQELERMKSALYKDELTNVFNRKWLFDTLVDKKHHFKHNGVMALIDLNYFKQINDTYGHVIGDKVLVFIATQLKKSKGMVVRYGGDEFLIFFENKNDVKSVKETLVKLRESILKKHLRAKNAEFRTSFSIGLCPYKEGNKLETILEKADNDMYHDKKEIKKWITGIEV